jgi:creatinine amidohydrolase
MLLNWQGFPTFDQAQADEYFKRVNIRIGNLIQDVITKWELARLYE